MKVLVSVASRHGSTMQIAECIREELEATDVRAHLMDPQDVDDLAGYDAVILGSAVYAGRWMAPARKLAERLQSELRQLPVWLFSSGPIGDPAKPAEPPVDGVDLAQRLQARDHQVFEGRLERDRLGFVGRAAVKVILAPDGDYRQWLAIGAWARQISRALQSGSASPVAQAV
jgi:menaquinone-dependent protoporphyrinogen oxidase